MQKTIPVILIGGIAVSAAHAQGGWQPQASPTPAPPPPVYYNTTPPPPPTPSTKMRGAVPLENPGNWVRTADYPAQSLRNRDEGTTVFRLTIDAKGRVEGCEVMESSGHAELDQTTCRLLRERGKFKPALDAKGKPTKGTYRSRIHWRIPTTYSALSKPMMPIRVTQTYIVETDGTPTNCQTFSEGNQIMADRESGPCGKEQKFTPYTDESGKPVRKKVTMTVTVTVDDPD